VRQLSWARSGMGRKSALSSPLGWWCWKHQHGNGSPLRGGLSLGLCGFSFLSTWYWWICHKKPEDLYRRWTPFGCYLLIPVVMCTSNRAWEYGEDFDECFRLADKWGMSWWYIYSAERTAWKRPPMLRALFIEYPWKILDRGRWWWISVRSGYARCTLFEKGYKRDSIFLRDNGSIIRRGKYFQVAGIIWGRKNSDCCTG